MWTVAAGLLFLFTSGLVYDVTSSSASGSSPSTTVDNTKPANESESRGFRALNLYNIVRFPNDPCTSGTSATPNGTCYTSSECSSRGGTASGSCASSFGVCCVFSMSCGSTISENTTYAIVTSFSTTSDTTPCSYTICPCSTSVCKIRLDFDTLVLNAPYEMPSTAVANDGPRVGDCIYDTMTITNPSGQSPPTICGYNTGQHMWLTASSQCHTININIDTSQTGTTRQWSIKATQFECGSMNAPELDCLQWLTGQVGEFSSFNWDTTATTVSSTQTHLSSQQYDVCFRRERSYCSICFSPKISSTANGVASSFGLSAGTTAASPTLAADSSCTGTTAFGDFIEVVNLQQAPGSSGTLGTDANVNTRLCGGFFNIGPQPGTSTQATLCSFVCPFKWSVFFNADEVITTSTTTLNAQDNNPGSIAGAGPGTAGFYMAYWQNAC